ncbi:MAG: sigma-54-dependent Fis family transcriptional regulator [Krumholzibacteria bacterium]|nr:sigma-54-dependent Fis family transcriptional regulator [Candidatus Krumholzibacteria bacterium]
MRASVLIVDDDAGLRRALVDRFEFWGHRAEVAPDGEQALALARRQAFDIIILDLSMPGLAGLEVLDRLKRDGCGADVVVLTAHGSLEAAVDAVKGGAEDFLTKPTDFDLLRRTVDRCLDRRRLDHMAEAATAGAAGLVRGGNPAMQKLLAMAERAAAAPTTLLITGESGTGKQVLAEHIHAVSDRARGPFVYVNCVAISDSLIESTLFGHERGAFTGAVGRKAGRLELAAGGTAFLDEIGDISAELQAKLLHFLETGEFERVGGNQTVRVDCRIVAATNRDLPAAVAAGEFREDLYYRLNVIDLHLPPLRERPEDIEPLAEAFLARLAVDLKRPRLKFALATLTRLKAYHWPGNVRNLRNAVERMAVLAPGDVLTLDLLPVEVSAGPDDSTLQVSGLPYKEAVTAFKRHLVRRALAETGGNQTRAADVLGLRRSYLNRLIHSLESGADLDE